MEITKELLREWNACTDGYKWFVGKFPQGGTFREVNRALISNKRYDDSRWLADKALSAAFGAGDVAYIAKLAGADGQQILEAVREIIAESNGEAATTGNYANAATTGEGANAATTGYYANAATTGYRANAATTGEKSIAACLGRDSKAMAGKDGCIIAAWWDEKAKRPRVVVGYVGEDGIKPETWYRAEAGKLIEAES